MKVNYQILSIALILCLAFLLLKEGLNLSTSENQNLGTKSEIVLENIHSRTSIRNYSDKKISKETLTSLVKAGVAAPTAGNMQPWNFLIIDDKEKLKEISQIHDFTNPVAGAAAAIIVTADMNTYAKKKDWQPFWVTDTSVAAQNILLAANSMGIGSVWLSVYPFKEQESNLRKIIDFPENTNILCIVSLGYPEKDVAPKNKWKEEKVSFGKFE